MSYWIGTSVPHRCRNGGFQRVFEALAQTGTGEEALLHARRALGIAPKNPFYLSYTGLLAALAEQRYADAEVLCREAIEMRHNHAQLYLNLAEVYQHAGRAQEAIRCSKRDWSPQGAISGFAALLRKSA